MNGVGMMMAKSAANSAIKDAGRAMGGDDTPNSHINWEDFNYPPIPFLKVIHYNLDELENPHKAIVNKLHLSVKLLMLALLVNLGNCIFVAIAYGSFKVIIYSVVHLIILPPLHIYSFYKGYRGICADASELKLYYYTQAFLIFIYILCSFASWLSFHGWYAVYLLFSGGLWLEGLIAIVESLIWTVNFLIMSFMVYVVQNYASKPHDQNQRQSTSVSVEISMA